MTVSGQTKLDGRFIHIDTLYLNGFLGYQNDFRNEVYYPTEIRKEKIIGNVYFEVEIDTVGRISDFIILKGIDTRLDNIVKEQFEKTNGKWKIIKDKNGKAKSYKIFDYIYFELR